MKYLIGLGAATVFVILFAYFWLFSGNDLQTAQEEMDQTVAELETQSAGKPKDVELNGFGSMNDLLSRDISLECQITTIDNDVASEGTYFVADQKMRGDFITDSPDFAGAAVSSLIVTTDTMYVWTELDGESFGAKFPLDTETDIQTQEPVKLDERVKYACQNWEQVDQSVFIPPSDVLFQDMTKAQQGGMEYGTVYEEGELPY